MHELELARIKATLLVSVESFPATAANYAKAVESLKARFGSDDLLVDVRELLKLIISVQKQEKISITSLYDKLESYLRALETSEVTTEKCASIPYLMVESCFQEDFLKAGNRSATSAPSTDAKERLTNLMTFLKAETEGEERINLAMAGFGLGVDRNRQSFKKKVTDFPTFSCQFINYSFKGSEEGMCFLYWEALEPRLFSSSEGEFG
ncbi:uncharacterized protein TNCV_3373331 [Trichonephila clavipes]|nr:uncharacterized protein TNCV_3373331 [Trichonephila clavipes]